MPGCVLRVQSKTKDVETLLRVSGLRPIKVYRKGEKRFLTGTAVSRVSGFNVDVSYTGGELPKQARDAVRFLRRHAEGLSRLRRHRQFHSMMLDFGLHDLASPEKPWPTYRLPRALVELAGKHRMEIELSFYGPA